MVYTLKFFILAALLPVSLPCLSFQEWAPVAPLHGKPPVHLLASYPSVQQPEAEAIYLRRISSRCNRWNTNIQILSSGSRRLRLRGGSCMINENDVEWEETAGIGNGDSVTAMRCRVALTRPLRSKRPRSDKQEELLHVGIARAELLGLEDSAEHACSERRRLRRRSRVRWPYGGCSCCW